MIMRRMQGLADSVRLMVEAMRFSGRLQRAAGIADDDAMPRGVPTEDMVEAAFAATLGREMPAGRETTVGSGAGAEAFGRSF